MRQRYLWGAPLLPSSPTPLPNKLPRRNLGNSFSQQRALVVGEKNPNNQPSNWKNTLSSLCFRCCEHLKAPKQAWWTRNGWEGDLEMAARAGRSRQAHPQVPSVHASPPPSSRTSDIRAIWIIRLQSTSPCETPAALGQQRGSTQCLVPWVSWAQAHVRYGVPPSSSCTAALREENPSK